MLNNSIKKMESSHTIYSTTLYIQNRVYWGRCCCCVVGFYFLLSIGHCAAKMHAFWQWNRKTITLVVSKNCNKDCYRTINRLGSIDWSQRNCYMWLQWGIYLWYCCFHGILLHIEEWICIHTHHIMNQITKSHAFYTHWHR